MAKFYEAFLNTGDNEKGFSDHALDKGGITYCGIAYNFHKNWEGWPVVFAANNKKPLQRGEIIQNISLDVMVQRFYQEKIWYECNLDDINSQLIANAIYDIAVNMHPITSVKFIQNALNLLNRNGKDYPDMKVDGKLGGVTAKAINEFRNPVALKRAFEGFVFMKRYQVCVVNPTQEEFFLGWLNRK